LIDRIDSGSVTKHSIGSIRDSARELGKTVANLPLPFGSDNEKVRYSDLPPALQSLIKDMMARVEKKIGSKDAAEASVKLASFKSGGDYFTQSEISAELSKMLRLLT